MTTVQERQGTGVEGKAQQVGEKFEWLGRAGWVAKGVVYGLIGVLFVSIAIGGGSGQANQAGAIESIAGTPAGGLLLVALGTGLFLYATWRVFTVILPGEFVVFTDDFASFRSLYPGDILVGGQYSGGLSGGGELITLSDAAGNLIDSVEYDDVAPWPTEPDGNGFTLALIDPTLDNSVAANWSPSNQINGTPGLPNDAQSVSTLVKVFAAIAANEY